MDTPENKPVEAVEAPKTEEKVPEMIWAQRIFVTFSDGRRGVFVGPAIMSEVEIKLRPPKLTNIEFSNPFPIVDKQTEIQEGVPSESGKENPDQSGK